MADANDILLAVGRLQASVDHIREEFTEEKRSASESRKAIYARHDDLNNELNSLRTDVGIHAQISAQTREEIKALGAAISRHKNEIQPSVEDWQRMKMLGTGIVGVLAVGGLSVGALIAWAGEATAGVIRRWLGIG